MGKEGAIAATIDIRDRAAIRARFAREQWALTVELISSSTPPRSFQLLLMEKSAMRNGTTTLDINVTANHRLTDEAAHILREQDLDASIVLTSSANAVVPKKGSEAYDVSKAAVNHLVRELAIVLSPKVRVNGISPATVVKGSTMFPRDRVIASLTKYKIAFDPQATRRSTQVSAGGILCPKDLDASSH